MALNGLKPLIDENSKILILGSFPSEVTLDVKKYYANPKNDFWFIMKQIFGDKYEDDYKLLKENNIALWDVIKSCDRAEGSSDEKIRNIIPNDISALLKKYKNIKYIIINGKTKAYEWFKQFNSNIGDDFEIFALPQTSGKVPRNQRLREWNEMFTRYKNLGIITLTEPIKTPENHINHHTNNKMFLYEVMISILKEASRGMKAREILDIIIKFDLYTCPIKKGFPTTGQIRRRAKDYPQHFYYDSNTKLIYLK